MDLAELRTLVSRDLHDESFATWSTDEIDRAIQLALQEFSYAVPVQALYTEVNVPSRTIDISALSERVSVLAVEFPTGNYPPTYVRFSLWGDTLSLLVDTVPDGAKNAAIYYGKVNSLITAPPWAALTAYSVGDFVLPTVENGYRYKCTVAGTSDAAEPTWPTTIGGTVVDATATWAAEAVTSTIPTVNEDLVSKGAQGYALVQWAATAINQVNVGGSNVARTYETQGDLLLKDFRRQLKAIRRQNRVRSKQLYIAYHPRVSKTTVEGP